MALDVRLSAVTPAESALRLQADSVRITIDRSPIVAPLPGGNQIMLDLGQRRVLIVAEGYLSESGTNNTEGGEIVADKDDLEVATEEWWDSTVTFTVSADNYQVKFKQCSFALDASRESFWHYTLQVEGFRVP